MSVKNNTFRFLALHALTRRHVWETPLVCATHCMLLLIHPTHQNILLRRHTSTYLGCSGRCHKQNPTQHKFSLLQEKKKPNRTGCEYKHNRSPSRHPIPWRTTLISPHQENSSHIQHRFSMTETLRYRVFLFSKTFIPQLFKMDLLLYILFQTVKK